MAGNRSSRTRLSWHRKAVYALVVTLGFFVVVEGLLALFGFEWIRPARDPFIEFEAKTPLFVEHAGGEDTILQTADNKRAFFNAQTFSKRKPNGTLRVFCLGGSTTYGRPYDDRTSFAGWLRELLPVAAADQRWEVINAGGISYASYRVAATMEELCEYSPDLFIVYTGHNEFLEERTYRDLRTAPAWTRRGTTWLHRTRTYALAHRLFSRENREASSRYLLPREVDTILDHASGPDAYSRDEKLRADILDHFAFNLERMLKTSRNAGAEIVFVSPAANLKDFSPFKNEHGSGLAAADLKKCAELFARAIELEEDGATGAALEALQQATEIDNRQADLHFHAGQLHFALGQFPAARAAFQRAIEEDVCPLRAIPEIPQIIEQLAVAESVPLVDFDAILKHDCLHHYGHASPGKEYFLDHVHPTVAAHRLLAVALVEALIRKGIAKPTPLWRADAVALASQRIGSRIDPELQSRALTNLAQVLSWAGKQEQAGPIAIEAVRLRSQQGLAEDPESLFYAGVHLAVTGSNERATELLEKAAEHEPHNAAVRWRLASLLYDQRKFSKAQRHFTEAVRLDPSDAYSHQMLGVIWLRSENYDEALTSLLQADELKPNAADIKVKIAFALQQLGREREAIAYYRTVLSLEGGTPTTHRQLGRLLMLRGSTAEAIQHFERANQLDPNDPAILEDLRAARRRLDN